jgi:hypothetical protein
MGWGILLINHGDDHTVTDGPHGARRPLSDLNLQESHPATCFPAGCAMAASWSVDALHQMGQALALECECYNVSVLLGPAMNLKRHPRGGRNLEYLYFSEDPFLSGTLTAAYVHFFRHVCERSYFLPLVVIVVPLLKPGRPSQAQVM